MCPVAPRGAVTPVCSVLPVLPVAPAVAVQPSRTNNAHLVIHRVMYHVFSAADSTTNTIATDPWLT